MEDSELISAAHHEAGHVVVAHVLGCRVDGLDLFRSDLNRWFGTSPVRLCKDDPQGLELLMRIPQLSAVGAKTALAGMLAQAKHDGIRNFGDGNRTAAKKARGSPRNSDPLAATTMVEWIIVPTVLPVVGE